MVYTIFSITIAILAASLIVCGYFLYLFRADQLSMRRVLLALITEMRVGKERMELQSKAIDAIRRDFSLQGAPEENESMLNDAIRMAKQGGSIEQLKMTFNLSDTEAAILVSNHGNLDPEQRDRVNQLYMS